ncbi:DUF6876 family protein [Chryseobacterium proteolyticum]|uniref:DUF6876 family protein n=1 Tax=Chryseobacterium proteolyticum TaxID=118127 RepID=UPI0039834071
MKNFVEPSHAYYKHFEASESFRQFKPSSITKTKTMNNKHNIRRNSANELYNVYSVAQDLHDYKEEYQFTEGINDMINFEDCLWLFDLILEEQPHSDSETQVWTLKRVLPHSFTLTCKNKAGQKLAEIKNIEASFYFDDLIVIKKDKLFCLPVEENIY